MEHDGLHRSKDRRCEFLCWKELLIDPAAEPSADQSFWCQKTQICLGPDGRLVEEAACNPSRGCYQPG